MLRRVLLLAVVIVGIPALLLEHGRHTPFHGAVAAPIFALWGIGLVVRAVRRKRRDGKGALAFNLGVVLLALAGAEVVLGHTVHARARLVRRAEPGAFATLDPLLGHRAQPGFQSRFTSMLGDETIFDVTYTVGEDGLRVRPPLADPPPEAAALLFSCSYVWGTGLEDDETWPWRLEQELGGRVRCYNFGFPAYSPSQMLAWLESGEAERRIRYPPRHVVYIAIVDHARRVIGQSGCSRNEPRYVLQPDGRVRREGQWRDRPADRWASRLRQLAHHSHVARLLMRRLAPTGRDEGLMAAIVRTARDRVRDRWPGCSFDVLLWDYPPSRADPVEAAMRRAGVDVTRMSTFLEGLREDAGPWRLHRMDDHPNARAASAIASHLARRFRDEPGLPEEKPGS